MCGKIQILCPPAPKVVRKMCRKKPLKILKIRSALNVSIGRYSRKFNNSSELLFIFGDFFQQNKLISI